MSIEDRVTGFSAFVEHLFFVGFSAVAFLALLIVAALLVRFLIVATKAAEIYVRMHAPSSPAAASPAPRTAPDAGPVRNNPPGVPPTRATGPSTADATPTVAYPVDPDRW